MAAKVDAKVLARILELRYKYGLTQEVIGTRLGLASRTVRFYLAQERKRAEAQKEIGSCSTPESLIAD
jgi:DNA-binding transcriptional regulator LsrR (DeoR family)